MSSCALPPSVVCMFIPLRHAGMVTFDEFLSLSETNRPLFDQLMGSHPPTTHTPARASITSPRGAGVQHSASEENEQVDSRYAQLQEYARQLERELNQCKHEKDLLASTLNTQLVDTEGMDWYDCVSDTSPTSPILQAM